jgi:uncharacterized delta-60 repeat protein
MTFLPSAKCADSATSATTAGNARVLNAYGAIRKFWPALLLVAFVALPIGPAQAVPGALDARFGAGGKVVTDFGPGDDEASTVLVLPNKRIVAAGLAMSGSSYEFGLARYKRDGSLDPSFGTGGKVTTAIGAGSAILGVVLQPNNRIVAAGWSRASVSGPYVGALARYKPDGSLDTGFGTGGIVTTAYYRRIVGIALQPDGSIVVAGGGGNFVLVRYKPDGSLDTSFGAGGVVTTSFLSANGAYASAVAIQPDGKILVAGKVYFGPPNYLFALARYTPNGKLDSSFGTGGLVTTSIGNSAEANALALQPDGKIVLSGDAGIGPKGYAALVRYDRNGALDTSFGSGGKVTTAFGTSISNSFAALALQLNRKIVAAGWTRASSTAPYMLALARYKRNGSLDARFGPGGKITTAFVHSAYVDSLSLQADGKIVATGGTGLSNKNWAFALARYQGDTCVVPKLKGRRLKAAVRLLKQRRCAVGKVGRRSSATVAKGRVISQRPAAGTQVAASWKVSLVVSKGSRRRD